MEDGFEVEGHGVSRVVHVDEVSAGLLAGRLALPSARHRVQREVFTDACYPQSLQLTSTVVAKCESRWWYSPGLGG